jgi:hypothetical protein
MVATSGGTERAGTLRRLNAPRAVQVRVGADGVPAAARQLGVWLEVLELLDCYRTDDRWWMAEPVARTYYALLLEDGRAITIFHDELGYGWWEQKHG